MNRSSLCNPARRFVGAPHGSLCPPPRRPALAFTVCLLLVPWVPWVPWAACGDSEPGGNSDGGLDAGDGGPADAVVDNGPLDCGVRPADGSVCVTGRLHDFVTDEPVTPGVENEIFSFFTGSVMLAARDSPDTIMGRVAPSGRYMTWTNGPGDGCLTLVDDVAAYTPATINCYSDSFSMQPALSAEQRFYLASDAARASWVDSYPGVADLQTDRPFMLGQCLETDWTRVNTGEYRFYSGDLPSGLSLLQSCYPLSEDRLSFLDLNSLLAPIQPGGAFLYYVPFEGNGDSQEVLHGLSFWCNGNPTGWFDIGRYDTEWGGIDLVILNNTPF